MTNENKDAAPELSQQGREEVKEDYKQKWRDKCIELNACEAANTLLDNKRQALEAELASLRSTISHLEGEIAEQRAAIDQLDRELREQGRKIAEDAIEFTENNLRKHILNPRVGYNHEAYNADKSTYLKQFEEDK